MSHKRSGLLAGLIVGFLAMLVGAAGIGAAFLFSPSLPRAVHEYAGGIPFVIGLGVAAALLVALGMTLARPRARTLPPMAALYATVGTAGGLIAGLATQEVPVTPADVRSPMTLPSFDTVTEAVAMAAMLFQGPVEVSWPAWASAAASALVAYALVGLRVRRLRRRAAAESVAREIETKEEPDYRAPFEPLQAAKPATGSGLFLPSDRGPA